MCGFSIRFIFNTDSNLAVYDIGVKILFFKIKIIKTYVHINLRDFIP